jgi:hypothetical protein
LVAILIGKGFTNGEDSTCLQFCGALLCDCSLTESKAEPVAFSVRAAVFFSSVLFAGFREPSKLMPLC